MADLQVALQDLQEEPGKEIVFSSKDSLWRLTVPAGSTPIRIPYVGEQGFTPTLSP
jgi:hypothetical protein